MLRRGQGDVAGGMPFEEGSRLVVVLEERKWGAGGIGFAVVV